MGSWLAGRNEQEAQCVVKYFEQIMDVIVEFVLHKTGYKIRYSIPELES